MSCRVFGLNVETAVMRLATHTVLSSGYDEVLGRLVHTDKNMPCQNWFASNGFSVQDGTWRLGNDAFALEDPAFIEVNAPVNAKRMCRETAVEADALA